MFEEVLARIRPARDSANNTDAEDGGGESHIKSASFSTVPGTSVKEVPESGAPTTVVSPQIEGKLLAKSSVELLQTSSPTFFLDSQPRLQEIQQAVPGAISKLRSLVLPETLSIPLVRPFNESTLRSNLLKSDTPSPDDTISPPPPVHPVLGSLPSWNSPCPVPTDRAFEKLEHFLVSFFQCGEQIEHLYRFREEEYQILRSIFLRKYKKWIFTT
jgi:hypothetical protein